MQRVAVLLPPQLAHQAAVVAVLVVVLAILQRACIRTAVDGHIAVRYVEYAEQSAGGRGSARVGHTERHPLAKVEDAAVDGECVGKRGVADKATCIRPGR